MVLKLYRVTAETHVRSLDEREALKDADASIREGDCVWTVENVSPAKPHFFKGGERGTSEGN